ncbi:hypothetical protein [Meridianimarinicoccus roseus]|uniref:hypothetical protein n=1 Tax=Meridianimarinicoccus roseus TaxID=2072018 RepID=UPI0011B1D0C2|nr:hypothetical protein [Meridianimarinicoccus roseus]
MPKYTIRHDKIETRSLLLGDGKLALGVTIGSLAVVLFYVAHEFFWGVQEASEYLSIAPLIISLLVAMGSTYFAANALLEQRRAREAGTDPVLIAHFGQRADARELITFNLSNVGAGAALNVQLDVERPAEDADDWEKRNFLQNIFKPRQPFSVILQGSSIEFSLALGWHLLGQEAGASSGNHLPLKPLPPFKAKLSYEDLAGGKYDAEFTLDVSELQGLGANKSPQMRMVAALETLAKKR